LVPGVTVSPNLMIAFSFTGLGTTEMIALSDPILTETVLDGVTSPSKSTCLSL